MADIKIYKGKSFTISKPEKTVTLDKDKDKNIYKKRNQKVIAFDLDETLGSFGELYILWQAINIHIHNEKNHEHQSYNMEILFQNLLDIYPEFLRHGILNILAYLYNKKLRGECSKVFLYTNNQCYGEDNSKWLSFITGYIDSKICSQKIVLFDKIICAFKINNQIIEPLRTTHNKTYSDFIRCSLLPKTAELCFIDNTYYNKMINDRVYYIQPRSYYHALSYHEIMNRFKTQWKTPTLDSSFIESWFSKYSTGSQKHTNLTDDIMVSQKIMYHLKEFFLLSIKRKKTKKLSVRLGKFTRKTRTNV